MPAQQSTKTEAKTVVKTDAKTEAKALDEGCTGDFAFDHLKQQENLSKKTLAELEDKKVKLEREFNVIVKEQPLLKKERSEIESIIKRELLKREQITKEYQALLAQFTEEEKRQQEER